MSSHNPDQPIERRLHDVHFRPIQASDWRRLQRFHQRLSATTIELRFHGAKRELSEPLAHRFTELDGKRNAAIIATTGTRGRIVGVARYFELEPGCAEVAFVVEDAYQHRGIGRRLMQLLRETALANGITELVADVLPGNTPMLHLLKETGPTEVRYRQGVCRVRVRMHGDTSPDEM